MQTNWFCAQEYIEREDEFDINPRPDEKPSGACANGRDDEEIDVETAEPIEALYCSSDEDMATALPRLHHLPLEIEPQRPSTPECALLSLSVHPAQLAPVPTTRSAVLCHPSKALRLPANTVYSKYWTRIEIILASRSVSFIL